MNNKVKTVIFYLEADDIYVKFSNRSIKDGPRQNFGVPVFLYGMSLAQKLTGNSTMRFK